MRKHVLAAALGLGGLLLAFAAAGVPHRRGGPPAGLGNTAPPQGLAARAFARATATLAVPQAAAQASARALPELPTVEVAPRPVHTVPEEASPPPGDNAADRARRIGAVPGAAAAAPRSTVAMPPPDIAGAAEAAGGTTLAVSGRVVRLFGVRAADPRERCGAGTGNCVEAARNALAQRLQRSPRVACRTPPGQRGNPAAICVDASGTDLGRFLVAEGLALADTSQSYEYFGAEGAARSYRRGLWAHR